MNARIFILFGCLAVYSSFAQGQFLFSNITAATRIGATNGPLAGPAIWAQMLVGTNTQSLMPVDMPRAHLANGFVSAPVISVPGIDGGMNAFVQMWAWNGALWGTSIEAVPADQFGKTDIVPIFLTFSFDPASAPQFTQGAVVPIPEPSTVALAVFGAGALWFATRRRRK